MRKKSILTSRLFIDLYRGNGFRNGAGRDEKKFLELKKYGVKTVIIASAEPVDGEAYNELVRQYRDLGLRVLSTYVDMKDPDPIGPMSGLYLEIFSALSAGNCLLVFYGRKHVGVLIAGLLVMQGYSIENTCEMLDGLSTALCPREDELRLMRDFEAYYTLGEGRALNLFRVREDAGNILIYYGNILIKTDSGTRRVADAVPRDSGQTAPADSAAGDAGKGPEEVEDFTDDDLFEHNLDEVSMEEAEEEDEFEMVLEEREDGEEPPPLAFDDEEDEGDQRIIVDDDIPKTADKKTVTDEAEFVGTETAEEAPVKTIAGEKPEITDKTAGAPPPSSDDKKTRRRQARTGRVYTSIRFKMISIISLIILVSLSGMIILATYFFRGDNEVRVQESNHKISEVVALKVQSDLLSLMERSRVLAGGLLEDRGAGASRKIQQAMMRSEKDLLFLGIAVVDQTGTRFVEKTYNNPVMEAFQITTEQMEKADESSAKVFAKTSMGETIIYNVSPMIDFPVMGMSFPLETRKTGGQTVLVAYLKLDSLLAAFGVSGITRVFLVNDAGDVIAHPDTTIVKSGGNFINLPIVTMMMKSSLDNGQTRFQDEKGDYHLGSFKKIGIGGCGVVATVDEQKAFEEVYNIQRRNMYLMGIVLTVAVLIVFFFGNSLTNPITRLLGATKRIKEGDYRVDIHPTSSDEIGELTLSFIEMGKGLEEREKMKTAFGKFVNPEIAEMVLRDEIQLGGVRKDGVVLFSDIRSFTAISEKLEPEEVVEFLNQYMTLMVDCIDRTGGVVDKFIGDAIMAVWGIPVSKGNDVENAINGAILMRQALQVFNRGRGSDKKPVIHFGCGINAGPLLAGQIGSENRMEYTVIGDTVNLASRVEALNKPFGTDILIAEETYERVKETFRVEKMQPIRVKGKEKPQQIYAVLGREDDPECPRSVAQLRSMLGIKTMEAGKGPQDSLEEEKKYEIIQS